MERIVAGIDVHKRVLMVSVALQSAAGEDQPRKFVNRRFASSAADLQHLTAWLKAHRATEVVMESTAQYWKPVWMALEPHFRLYLAQAWSNRAPRGKKTDCKDAQRLVRRHLAEELTLSFVPDGAQRILRSLTRRRVQLTEDRVRTQNQVESLLEETQIKLASVLTELFGASGLRILQALVDGEQDAEKLAALADARVKQPPAVLLAALTGVVTPVHRQLLEQHLQMRAEIDRQLAQLEEITAQSMQEHSEAIARLTAVPGIRRITAEQIVAEAGPQASTFPSAAQFSAWIGVCPGKMESAGENHSSRCAKGNMYLRRVLCQAAQAAVRTKNSWFEAKFHKLLPRLGYSKAVWAIARHLSVVIWKILHDGAAYVEHGAATTPQALKRRLQRIRKELKAYGYEIIEQLKTPNPEANTV